ncbi:MAG: ribosome small subunit-dependent GTPase A [Candidatus Hydrothermarchaeales archaeon]
MSKIDLESIGWDPFFEATFKEFPTGFQPGRISARHKNSYRVLTSSGEVFATISGKMHLRKSYPIVGDWVAVSLWEDGKKATIEEILPRRTSVSRKVTGKRGEEQVIVANVDHIFIVTSLDRDFNLKRLERYLAIVRESGAKPVIILNKADLCMDVVSNKIQVEVLAKETPVYVISALNNKGLNELTPYLKRGMTVALLGSSGVGKSTLINSLLRKDALRVQEVRETDHRGRHTTTHRELYNLENGGMVIDNPGMREIQLLNVDEGIKETFSDIEELAGRCKYKDCRHMTELKCAVKEAIEEGTLSPGRLENYNKLKREVRYSSIKDTLATSRAVDRAKWDHIIRDANLEDGFDHRERAAFKRKIRKKRE